MSNLFRFQKLHKLMKILNNYKEGNKNLCEIKHLSRTYFINLDKFQLFFFLQSSLNLFEYAGWLPIKGLKGNY